MVEAVAEASATPSFRASHGRLVRRPKPRRAAAPGPPHARAMNRFEEVARIGNVRILADQLTRLELVGLDQLGHAGPDLLA